MVSRSNASTHYDRVIQEMFSRKCPLGASSFEFEKADLEAVIDDLEKRGQIDKIKNIPDIKYTYDARREFPSSVSSTGSWAIIGRGKSKYAFVKIPQPNLIRLPNCLSRVPTPTTIRDQTPIAVARVIGNDEQATMTRVHYNNLMGLVTGLKVWRVQGHERTTVSCGQIEVDEVYVGKKGPNLYVLPISAKGGNADCLSYTQALNLNLYGNEKSRYDGYTVRAFGISKKANGDVYVVEFSNHTDISQIRIKNVQRYIFR